MQCGTGCGTIVHDKITVRRFWIDEKQDTKSCYPVFTDEASRDECSFKPLMPHLYTAERPMRCGSRRSLLPKELGWGMENPYRLELPKLLYFTWNPVWDLPKRLIGKVIYWFNALLCYPAPPRGGYIRGANQISGATICALGICYLWILQKYPQLRQCIRAIPTTTQLTSCDTLTREIVTNYP